MIEQDTIKLLRECDAGVKMGVSSIESVVERIHDEGFRQVLVDSRHHHDEMDREIRAALHRFHDGGKEPAPMAKGMSWLKTNAMLMMDNSDATIADLMTDGCNMGVKSLNRYLNQYKAADEVSKDMCKRLIHLEQELTTDIQQYL